MKASKSSTTKRRRLKKVVVVEEENIEVVKVRGGEDIDLDVAAATEKRRKEIHIAGKTRSSLSKSVAL